MVRRRCRFSIRSLSPLILLLWTLSSQAQTAVAGEPATPPTAQVAPQPSSDIQSKLGPGDLIEVSVYGVPDLTTKARVSNSGDVYLPLIDYVHLADLTVGEAQSVIEKRLSDGGFVRNPHVSIFVSESTSQAINIMGEIARPGPYPAIGERRLFDLISAAGGLTDRAGRNVTIIHKQNPDQKVELQLAASLAEDTQNNIEILPGDTVLISRAGIVYVVGDVARPSGFMIEDNNLSVLKALALAGGGTRTASLNGAKILRQNPSGVQEIPVRLKKILQAKAPDVPLVKGDILFVPGSTTKAVALRGVQAVTSLTSALAVVAIR